MKDQREGEEKRREIVSYLKDEGPSRLWKIERDLVGEKDRNFRSKQNLIYHLKKLCNQGEVKKHSAGRMSTYFLPGQKLPEELTGTKFFLRNPARLIEIIERAIDDVQEEPMGFENVYTRYKFISVAGSVYRVVTNNIDELPDFPLRLYPLVYFDHVEDWWVDVNDILRGRRHDATKWLVRRKEGSGTPGKRRFRSEDWELPQDKRVIPPGQPESADKLLSWVIEVADWLESHK